MNARNHVLKFAGAVALGLACWVASAACSSSNNNPTPDAGGGGSSSSSGGGSSSSSSSGGGTDGGCATDAAGCNSCSDPVADPYNACTSYVTNCIPFDDTRVPTHPTL